ncbi:MAG: hypothetical protein JXR73_20505 [Candidatus Omnitrophica bacterium]|nr:hypothetical protein [Candidatus Omnitrophota bacterium]
MIQCLNPVRRLSPARRFVHCFDPIISIYSLSAMQTFGYASLRRRRLALQSARPGEIGAAEPPAFIRP